MIAQKIWSKNSSIIITYVIAIMLLVIVSIARPGYASVNNLNVLAVSAAFLGITALGQTFVVLTGGMDLSIPWMFTMSAFMLSSFANGSNEALVWVVPVVLLIGAGLGFINGVGVAYLGITPVIMTLSTNVIFQGLLLSITGGVPANAPPSGLQDFSNGTTMGVSNVFWVWIILSVIAIVVLYKTKFGRSVYAVGCNENVALFSGINIKHIKLAVFVICGMLAAAGGMLNAGRLSQPYLGMGDLYQMQTVAAVSIGGVALRGGSGSYVGAIAGVLILTILDGVLSALNIPPSVRKIVYGVVLFVAVLITLRETKNKK